MLTTKASNYFANEMKYFFIRDNSGDSITKCLCHILAQLRILKCHYSPLLDFICFIRARILGRVMLGGYSLELSILAGMFITNKKHLLRLNYKKDSGDFHGKLAGSH